MDRPHLEIAPGGGYIVDISPEERWWVQADVEPFRTVSRTLMRMAAETRVPMHLEPHSVRADLIELETLSMAWRIP